MKAYYWGKLYRLPKKEGIQRSKDAQEDAAFMEAFNQAKDEFSESKSAHPWFD